jgi:DNA-binding winged helix-turn-helix (wHTH) protein/TolB-like protein/Flp pilus assembly protein TadD
MVDEKLSQGESPFRLGEWLVEPDSGTLRRRNDVVHLEPKVMELLVYLRKHQGRVVPKQELFGSLWPDTFVAETALTRCISQLRHALRDDPKSSLYIETVPKKGYRLVAGLQEAATPDTEPVKPPPVRKRLIGVAAATLLGLIVLGVTGGRWYWKSGPNLPSLGVIPLTNLGASSEDDYFSEGLTEDVVAELSRYSGFQAVVRLRNEDRHLTADRRRLARALGASFILTGTFRKSEDTLQIKMLLVEPKSDATIWRQNYDLEIAKALTAPRDIAANVATALKVPLMQVGVPEVLSRQGTDLEAYKLSLRARYFRNLETWDGFRKAEQYYRQATERDPANAHAWAGLSEVYLLMAGSGTEDHWSRKAQQAMERALALNAHLPEAHVANGMIRKRFHRDYAGAEAAFKEALRLAPRHPDARREYGLLLLRELGRLDEALAQLEYAANLDPLSPRIISNLSELYRARGEFDRAMEVARKQLELNLRDPRGNRNMALAYFLLGDNDKALHWAKKSAEVQEEHDRGRYFERGLQVLTLAQLYSGRTDEARQTSQQILTLAPTSPQARATAGVVALWKGDYREAAARLESAVQLDPSGYLWPSSIRLSSVLGYALLKAGDQAGAERALALSDRLNQAEEVPGGAKIVAPDRLLDITAVHAIRGETDEACEWFRRMVDSGYRSFVFIKRDPWFEGLRRNPEMSAIFGRMQEQIGAMIARVETQQQ